MKGSKLTRRQMLALCGGLSPVLSAGTASDKDTSMPAGTAAGSAMGDQSVIGKLLYPQNSAESAASVVPMASQFTWGDLRRYGGDPTGTADSSVAWANAVKCGYVEIPQGCTFKIATGANHSGQITVNGSGATSVLLCDGPILTLTQGTRSVIGNFGMDSITPPLVFQRHVETTVRTTCISHAGASTIRVASANGITVGMRAMGPNVWQGTTVTNVDGSIVTLSRPNA